MKKLALFILGIFTILLVLLKPSDEEIRIKFNTALNNNGYDGIESYASAEKLKVNDYMFFTTLEYKSKNVGYTFLNNISINNVE